MKADLLDLLACPECLGTLVLFAEREESGEVESGTLACAGCPQSYPIIRFIPRFVPTENYASNFGFQWNRFRQTQLDSYSGVPVSRERFFLSTGWTPEEMARASVLDVGCGAGRFTEVSLASGARVVAVDYSSAVDACFANHGSHSRLDVVQANIYHLPFHPAHFQFVYCLGVLQHTPDVRRAFHSLPRQVREGGKLAVDVYPKLSLNVLWPKYWLRPITKRIRPQRLFSIVEWLVPILLRVSNAISRIPLVGHQLRYAVPVVNHRPAIPRLTERQVHEWAVLDTFDMFGPAYDQPQSELTLLSWAREAGLRHVTVFRSGQVILQAMR
jgi:SAM-dependent methyltransferase